MNLYQLILAHAEDDALAGNWTRVAATLNGPTVKVQTQGKVSVAGMAQHATASLATKFLATMRGTIDLLAQGDATQKAQAILFGSFLDRFVSSENGLDFSNDELRGYIGQICTSAGWSSDELNAVLAIGYVVHSLAQVHVGREVTADQCQAAWGKATQQAWLQNAVNNAENQIDNGQFSNIDDLKSYLAGL